MWQGGLEMILRWLVTLMVVLLASPVFGQDAGKKDDYKVMGAKKCKICHSTDKKAGTHYKIWEEELHAKAFANLASDKGKEAAKKRGIEDPQKDERCLACHSVKGSPAPEEGVSCEACHGPAEAYLKPHEKEGLEAATKLGMVPLRTMKPEEREAVCLKCHKQDPMNDFYKEFKYDEFFAKIDHSKATSPAILEKRPK
jgi:hypothetical protein